MTKQVLDVGNCTFDHRNIKQLIESHFDASVIRARNQEDAIATLRSSEFALVLINRVFHQDGSEGFDLISQIKSDPQLKGVPTMLISDFEDYQRRAIDAGAEPGFGKKTLRSAETQRQLSKFLIRANTAREYGSS
jgi:two-component system, chemotaxis family, chemotaxis protein CheY